MGADPRQSPQLHAALRVAREHSALQLGPAIQEALLGKLGAALSEVVGGNSLSAEDKKCCCSSPQVVCEHYRQFGIPKDLRGIWQYLNNAQEVKEFKYTCPNNEEIVQAYSPVDRSSGEQRPLPSPRSPMAPLSPSINGQCQSPRAGGGAGGRV